MAKLYMNRKYSPELKYEDFSKKQKEGIDVYWNMTSEQMIKARERFKKESGKPCGINTKGEFYGFIANNYKKIHIKKVKEMI